MKTVKLFYTNQYECTATITAITEQGIILSQTVAYQMGGGQEGDSGEISLISSPNTNLKFMHTIKDDEYIYHIPAENTDLSQFSVNDQVLVKIDKTRRKNLTKMHTATHLMYWAIDLFKTGVVHNTIGCHIKEDSGRLDFAVDYKFGQDDLVKIAEIANEIIDKAYPIKIEKDKENPDRRYWVCNDYIIPCGGTHMNNTNAIPHLIIKRKNVGKGKERLICMFQGAKNE